MMTCEARVVFGKERDDVLVLELFCVVGAPTFAAKRALTRAFDLVETAEVPGMVTLRSDSSVTRFLSYFGYDWLDALERWPTLRGMQEYRQHHGPHWYSSVAAWMSLYDRIETGIYPRRIAISVVEND